jgi:hypothetical protein
VPVITKFIDFYFYSFRNLPYEFYYDAESSHIIRLHHYFMELPKYIYIGVAVCAALFSGFFVGKKIKEDIKDKFYDFEKSCFKINLTQTVILCAGVFPLFFSDVFHYWYRPRDTTPYYSQSWFQAGTLIVIALITAWYIFIGFDRQRRRSVA